MNLPSWMATAGTVGFDLSNVVNRPLRGSRSGACWGDVINASPQTILPPWAEALRSSGQAKTQTGVDCNAPPSRPHASWLRKAFFFCNRENLFASEYA